MQRIRVLVPALIAVLALGAVASTAAFGAGVELLNNKKEQANAETFKGNSVATMSLGVLQNSTLLECAETLFESEQEGFTQLGLFHIHLHKCKTSLGGTCTGLGDESGLILLLGKYHIVYDKLSPELRAGYLLLFEHVHLACTVLFVTKLILVLGELLCLISPVSALAKKFKVKCERGAEDGDPGEIVYWKDDGSGTEVNIGLNGFLCSEDEGKTYEMCSELGEFEIESTNEIEIMV